MTDSRLSPKHIEALFLQTRAMDHYLALLKRRLVDLKLVAEEPELYEYLTDASDVMNYLSTYLHDRTLKSAHGGWDFPFDKMMRPGWKLKRLK